MARFRSPFLKRVLIPFWAVRLSILITESVITAIAINFIRINAGRQYLPGNTPRIAIFASLEAALILCTVLDVTCIIRYALGKLTPLFFLVTSVVQTVIFFVLFGVSLLRALTLLNLLLNIFILLSFAGLVVYASVVFHKNHNTSKSGNYESANPLRDTQNLVMSTGHDLRSKISTKYEPYRRLE